MLTGLRCYHWRNLDTQFLDFSSSTIFLVGENGQGKSNLLEAIYYLIYQSSWRPHEGKTLLKQGKNDGFSLQGDFCLYDSQRVKLSLRQEGSVKTLLRDEQKIKDRREFFSICSPLIFSPGDLALLQGPPNLRRGFLDQTLTLLEADYLSNWRAYARILIQRNALLKKKSEQELNAFDPIFIRLANLLTQSRRRLVKKLAEKINDYAHAFLGDCMSLSLSYEPSLTEEDRQASLDFLKKKRKYELEHGFSLYGPHKDQFNLKSEGNLINLVASQGQLRVSALCLRLMQANLLGETNRGLLPTLLLDDILLELDMKKREVFFELLPPYTQAFFTFLPHEPYLNYLGEKTIVYKVKEGTFSLCKL